MPKGDRLGVEYIQRESLILPPLLWSAFLRHVALAQEGGVTLSDLATVSGRTKSAISKALNGHSEMGLFAALSIFEELGFDPSPYFRSLGRPVVDTVLDILAENRSLDAIPELIEFCDFYEVPTEKEERLTLIRMGKRSFSTEVLGEHAPKKLQSSLNGLSAHRRTKLLATYQVAAAGHNILTIEDEEFYVFGNPERQHRRYKRLLFGICDDRNTKYVGVFCSPIPKRRG